MKISPVLKGSQHLISLLVFVAFSAQSAIEQLCYRYAGTLPGVFSSGDAKSFVGTLHLEMFAGTREIFISLWDCLDIAWERYVGMTS